MTRYLHALPDFLAISDRRCLSFPVFRSTIYELQTNYNEISWVDPCLLHRKVSIVVRSHACSRGLLCPIMIVRLCLSDEGYVLSSAFSRNSTLIPRLLQKIANFGQSEDNQCPVWTGSCLESDKMTSRIRLDRPAR